MKKLLDKIVPQNNESAEQMRRRIRKQIADDCRRAFGNFWQFHYANYGAKR